jgi:hypothetical protein
MVAIKRYEEERTHPLATRPAMKMEPTMDFSSERRDKSDMCIQMISVL